MPAAPIRVHPGKTGREVPAQRIECRKLHKDLCLDLSFRCPAQFLQQSLEYAISLSITDEFPLDVLYSSTSCTRNLLENSKGVQPLI